MDTRKKKCYLVIVGLSGIGLIADSMISSDSGTVPATVEAAATGPIVNAAADTRPPIPTLPFPRSLRTWNRSSDLRDIFLPPQLESTATGEGPSADETTLPVDDETGRQSFASRHALHAIMVNGSLQMAVVDGTWVRVGESFDGCELERISNNQASFSCYDGIVTLVAGIPDLPFSKR